MSPPPRKQDGSQILGNFRAFIKENLGFLEFLPSRSRSTSNFEVGYSKIELLLHGTKSLFQFPSLFLAQQLGLKPLTGHLVQKDSPLSDYVP